MRIAICQHPYSERLAEAGIEPSADSEGTATQSLGREHQLPLTTKERLKTALGKAHRDLQNRNLRGNRPSELAKKKSIPLSSFRVWDRLLRDANDDPRALMDARPGNTSVRFAPEIEDKMREMIDEHYLGERGNSILTAYEFFEPEARELNTRRRAAGLEPYICLHRLKTEYRSSADYIARALLSVGVKPAFPVHCGVTVYRRKSIRRFQKWLAAAVMESHCLGKSKAPRRLLSSTRI